MPSTRFARACLFLVFAGLLHCVHAAELGEPLVRTYIGQPLVADIELTMLADPAVPVTVRVAHADVYRGANIAMHPVLAQLAMSVMRRDGRQFLHITSVRAVESDYVHLFLELNEGGKRNVRGVTLWLSPDPAPPPPPPPPPPVARPTADQELEAAAARAAMAAPKPSLLARARRDAAPAACPPQAAQEQLKACAEVDYKNGLLSAQIVELEEKVKLLQLAIEGKNALPPASARAVQKAASAAPPAAPPRPAPAKVKAGFPWMWVGIGVAAVLALGAGVFVFLRRRKAKSAETAASDSAAWYARLAARLKRKPKEAAPPVEPTA